MQLGISQSKHSLVAVLHQNNHSRNGQRNFFTNSTFFSNKIRDFYGILKPKVTNSRTPDRDLWLFKLKISTPVVLLPCRGTFISILVFLCAFWLSSSRSPYRPDGQARPVMWPNKTSTRKQLFYAIIRYWLESCWMLVVVLLSAASAGMGERWLWCCWARPVQGWVNAGCGAVERGQCRDGWTLVVVLLSAASARMGERRFLASTTTTVSRSALGRYDRENITSPTCSVYVII